MHLTLTHNHYKPGQDPILQSFTTICHNTRQNWLHFANLKAHLLKENVSEVLKDLDEIMAKALQSDHTVSRADPALDRAHQTE